MMIELTEQEELATLYSDIHKDAYGFRPRYSPDLSVQQLLALIDDVSKAAERTAKWEREQQEAAAVEVEKRITATIEAGAGDRATALRWIMQAEDADDLEHLCWKLGVRFGYFNKL